jgi:hypothetical protein
VFERVKGKRYICVSSLRGEGKSTSFLKGLALEFELRATLKEDLWNNDWKPLTACLFKFKLILLFHEMLKFGKDRKCIWSYPISCNCFPLRRLWRVKILGGTARKRCIVVMLGLFSFCDRDIATG